MPPLKVGSFGRKGVNTVDSPLHLTDDDLAAGQNAEIFFEDGYPAIRKRLGIADGVTSAMNGEVLAVSSIPLPDPDPSHGMIVTLAAGAHRYSPDGLDWSATISDIATQGIQLAQHQGRSVSIGPDVFYYNQTVNLLTYALRAWDAVEAAGSDIIRLSWAGGVPQGGVFYDRGNRKNYWHYNHIVYENGTDISGSTFNSYFPASLAKANGSLYLATADNLTPSLCTILKIWRWNGGQSWTELSGGITDAAPYYCTDMWDCNGVLYATTYKGICRVIGAITRPVATGNYRSVFFHAGLIFVSEWDGANTILYRSSDGVSYTSEATLTPAAGGTLGGRFCVFKGRLYCAVNNMGVYLRDDTLQTWSQVFNNTGVAGNLGAF